MGVLVMELCEECGCYEATKTFFAFGVNVEMCERCYESAMDAIPDDWE